MLKQGDTHDELPSSEIDSARICEVSRETFLVLPYQSTNNRKLTRRLSLSASPRDSVVLAFTVIY